MLDLVQIGMSKINTYPDEAGVVLSNLEEAVAYSRRVATELAEERRWQGYVIAISDENDAEIARIRVGNPEAA